MADVGRDIRPTRQRLFVGLPVARAGFGCAAVAARFGLAAAFGGALPARIPAMVVRVVI